MNSEVIPVFGYEYDAETGGLLLNDSTPNSSKEPRPVYATEMRMPELQSNYSEFFTVDEGYYPEITPDSIKGDVDGWMKTWPHGTDFFGN